MNAISKLKVNRNFPYSKIVQVLLTNSRINFIYLRVWKILFETNTATKIRNSISKLFCFKDGEKEIDFDVKFNSILVNRRKTFSISVKDLGNLLFSSIAI